MGELGKCTQQGVGIQCNETDILNETGGEELSMDPDRVEETWQDRFFPLSVQFAREQEQDTSLVHILTRLASIDRVPIEGVVINPEEYCFQKNDLLYRGTVINGSPVEQLLVPPAFRHHVLKLVHSHLFGTHLATDKTLSRIIQRFYWLGIRKTVEYFCKSCPTCQRASPRPHL